MTRLARKLPGAQASDMLPEFSAQAANDDIAQCSASDAPAKDTRKPHPAEEIIGYTFRDFSLLECALTHPSAAEKDQVGMSYERLEFLGDSILGAIVSLMLYERFPNKNEGWLTRAKIALVSGQTLSAVAEELGLAEHIRFGSSEHGTGKRGLASALENVFEAIVAAIDLDGGVAEARDFVSRTLAMRINGSIVREQENPKSLLQEKLQAEHITPTYELIATDGPPHARVFTCQVLADGNCIGTGSGKTKKDAEAAAAQAALAAGAA